MLLRNAECLPRGPLRDRRYRLFQSHVQNSGAPRIVHLYLPVNSILGDHRGLAQEA